MEKGEYGEKESRKIMDKREQENHGEEPGEKRKKKSK